MSTDPLLGEPFTTRVLPLAADAEGEVTATLVSRLPAEPTGRAVLYLHGFVDYFFQRELADFYVERGYAFHALDWRKSGRSLRPHQTPWYVEDLSEYFEELDAAVALLRADGARQLLVNGHSTGGLVAALWAQERRSGGGGPDGLFLNSPFLDLAAPALVREASGTIAGLIAARRPHAAVPGGTLSDLYPRSLHRDHGGEWAFDLTLKPIGSVVVRAGWLRAIRRGQRRVHRGLDVRVPILVMCSATSSSPRAWDEVLLRSDAVLDADQIARWSTRLGSHVTCVRIEDGMHDLVLSRAPVRAEVYRELERWLAAYLPAPA